MGLSIRRKAKKCLASRVKEPLEVPQSFTHTGNIDFMSGVFTMFEISASVYTGGQKAKPCWLRLDRVGCMVFMFLKQDNTLSRNII